MSKPYETIDLGTHYKTINGHNVKCILVANLYVDEDFSIDWDVTKSEKESLERRINRGDVTPTGIVVIAYANNLGVEGSDSLWGCLPANSQDIQDTIKEHDMIRCALQNLTDNLIDTANKTAKFASKG